MTPRNHRLLLALGLAVLTSSSRAALLWESDFTSYDTGGGAMAVTINSTGDDNTFTAAIPNGNLSSPIQQVNGSGVPAFMSGNALFIGGTANGSNISFALQQNAIASVGSSGLLVVSFDLYNTSPSALSTTAEARTSGGRSGSTTFSSSTPVSTALRVTLVINKTGSAITLPNTLGALATDSLAVYRFDGTSYAGLATSTGIGNTVTGFATGFSLSTSVSSSTYGLWLDNFGAWDSSADTVNGTSVFELAPGALTSIPEPAATATLLGLSVFGLIVFRRKSRL
jgi:hypothetical protein